MAQFDVFRLANGPLVDLQTDLIGIDASRIVIPLREAGRYVAFPGLTPQVMYEGARWIVRVEELPHHRKQVVDRHQQRLAQDHRHGLLRRGQSRLQPVRRVAAVMHRVSVLPFVDGLLGRAEPFRQHRRRHVAGLNRRPDFRRRRCLAVKMDQHARTPPQISRRTDLAMKNAERRGSM